MIPMNCQQTYRTTTDEAERLALRSMTTKSNGRITIRRRSQPGLLILVVDHVCIVTQPLPNEEEARLLLRVRMSSPPCWRVRLLLLLLLVSTSIDLVALPHQLRLTLLSFSQSQRHQLVPHSERCYCYCCWLLLLACGLSLLPIAA